MHPPTLGLIALLALAAPCAPESAITALFELHDNAPAAWSSLRNGSSSGDQDGGRLQAETAYLVRAEADNRHGGYEGRGYVDYADDRADGVIEWIDVAVANAGEQLLAIRYANGGADPHQLRIVVNGVDYGLHDLNPTGGWNRWSVFALPVDLDGSGNVIRLEAPGPRAPNIDYIDVGD